MGEAVNSNDGSSPSLIFAASRTEKERDYMSESPKKAKRRRDLD